MPALHPQSGPGSGPPLRPLGRNRQDRMRTTRMSIYTTNEDLELSVLETDAAETPTAAPALRSARLSSLDTLESEAIHIIREVVAEFEKPALLFSGGKDSVVM